VLVSSEQQVSLGATALAGPRSFELGDGRRMLRLRKGPRRAMANQAGDAVAVGLRERLS
jgi:hypothetical protein